jgi:hypothetical protein
MLLKCYHHLHPLVENEISFTNIGVDEGCNLNIFEKSANTNEPTKRTCEQGAPHFQTISNGCEGNKMLFALVAKT